MTKVAYISSIPQEWIVVGTICILWISYWFYKHDFQKQACEAKFKSMMDWCQLTQNEKEERNKQKQNLPNQHHEKSFDRILTFVYRLGDRLQFDLPINNNNININNMNNNNGDSNGDIIDSPNAIAINEIDIPPPRAPTQATEEIQKKDYHKQLTEEYILKQMHNPMEMLPFASMASSSFIFSRTSASVSSIASSRVVLSSSSWRTETRGVRSNNNTTSTSTSTTTTTTTTTTTRKLKSGNVSTNEIGIETRRTIIECDYNNNNNKNNDPRLLRKFENWNKFSDGLLYGTHKDIGPKDKMEDCTRIYDNFGELYDKEKDGYEYIPKKPQKSFLLFDGHGGDEAANFVCDNLAPNIAKCIQAYHRKLGETTSSDDINYSECIRKGFKQTDKDWCDKIENEHLHNPKKQCGAGAVGVFALIIDDILYCANVGDAQAFLGRQKRDSSTPYPSFEADTDGLDGLDAAQGGTKSKFPDWVVELTQEHDTEKDINENNKKYIKVTPFGKRLGGDLEVTRAFGDYIFGECEKNTKNNHNDDDRTSSKKQEEKPSLQFQRKTPDRCHKLKGLICDPYITRRPLNEGKDEFIVVASDGVWKLGGVEKTMTNVRQYLQKGDCKLASKQLIEFVKNHAQDNLSAIIIGFAEQVVNNDLTSVTQNSNGIIQNPYKFQIIPPLPKFCGSRLRCRFRNSRIKFSSKSSTISRATSEEIIKPDLALPNGAIITASLSNPPLQREEREQTGKHCRRSDEHRKDKSNKNTHSTHGSEI